MADRAPVRKSPVGGLTREQLAEMRPAREVMTPEEFAAVTGRGRPRSADPKVPVYIRLDREVVEAFKATGKGWQTRLNDVLVRELARARKGRKVA